MDALWRLTGVGQRDGRLTDVDLVLAPGVTAVVGPSGAGKTSLLNLLVGFERPASGSIEPSIEAPAGRPAVYWAPQDGGLWDELTVAEHLAAVARDDAGRRARLLEALGLTMRIDAYPARLSGGERSRLALARALAAAPVVLVLDEPLGGLGPMAAADGWRTIREALGETGASLVFASHDPTTVRSEAEHVVCLDAGRVVHQGAVRALYDDPPDPGTGAFLGPLNWLAEGEAELWLTAGAPACLRPERLVVEAVPGGPLVVQEARFGGALAELALRHEPSGRVRRFWHRPPGDGLRPGDRVRLSWRAP